MRTTLKFDRRAYRVVLLLSECGAISFVIVHRKVKVQGKQRGEKFYPEVRKMHC